MVDFSLSSLLGEKSPRRDVTDPAATLSLSKSITSAATGGVLSGVSIPDRPASVLSSDDTRMSFLNKLDVGDLGVRFISCIEIYICFPFCCLKLYINERYYAFMEAGR